MMNSRKRKIEPGLEIISKKRVALCDKKENDNAIQDSQLANGFVKKFTNMDNANEQDIEHQDRHDLEHKSVLINKLGKRRKSARNNGSRSSFDKHKLIELEKLNKYFSLNNKQLTGINLLIEISFIDEKLALNILNHLTVNKWIKNVFSEDIVTKTRLMEFVLNLFSINSNLINQMFARSDLLQNIMQNVAHLSFDQSYKFVKCLCKWIYSNQLTKEMKIKLFDLTFLTTLFNLCNVEMKMKTVCKIKLKKYFVRLLLLLCTDLEHGIIFNSSYSDGTKAKPNFLMYEFLEIMFSKNTSTDINMILDVASQIVRSCPDVLQAFFTLLSKCNNLNVNILTHIIPIIETFEFKQVDEEYFNEIVKTVLFPLPIMKILNQVENTCSDLGSNYLFNASNKLIELKKLAPSKWAVHKSNLESYIIDVFKIKLKLEDFHFNNEEVTQMELLKPLNSTNYLSKHWSVKSKHNQVRKSMEVGVLCIFALVYYLSFLKNRNSKMGPNLTELGASMMNYLESPENTTVLSNLTQVLLNYFDLFENMSDRIKLKIDKAINFKDISLSVRLLHLQMVISNTYPNKLTDYENICFFLKSSKQPQFETARKALKGVLSNFMDDEEFDLWVYCIERRWNDGIAELVCLAVEYAKLHKNHLIDFSTVYNVCEVSDMKLNDLLKSTSQSQLKSPKTRPTHLGAFLPSLLHIVSASQDRKIDISFIDLFVIHQITGNFNYNEFVNKLNTYNISSITKIFEYFKSSEKEVQFNTQIFNDHLFDTAFNYIINGKEMIEELLDENKTGIKLLLRFIIFVLIKLQKYKKLEEDIIARSIKLLEILIKEYKDCDNIYDILFEHFSLTEENGLSGLITHLAIINNAIFTRFSDILLFKVEKQFMEDNMSSNVYLLLHKVKMSKDYFNKFIMHCLKVGPKQICKSWRVTFLCDHIHCVNIKNMSVEQQLLITKTILYSVRHNMSLGLNFEGFFDPLWQSGSDFKTDETVENCIRELFENLCSESEANERFISSIAQLKFLDIPEKLSIHALVTIMSQYLNNNYPIEKYAHCFNDHVKSIVKALTFPKSWINKLVALSECFPVEFCQQLRDEIKHHLNNIKPTQEVLDTLVVIFLKCGKIHKLADIIFNWLTTDLAADNKYSVNLCFTLIRIASSNSSHSQIVFKNDLTQQQIGNLIDLGLSSYVYLDFLTYYLTQKPLTALGIFDVLNSHSEFKSILLNGKKEKESLLKLILFLISKDTSLAQAEHVKIYLSAYNATLSLSDQLLLQILKVYDKCGIIKFNQLFIWGEKAHFVPSRFQHIIYNTAFRCSIPFNISTVHATINKFPLWRSLTGTSQKEIDGIYDEGGADDIYDPAFYLPLLANTFIKKEKNINAMLLADFFYDGAIALVTAALSSHIDETRYLAGYIIQQLQNYNHLHGNYVLKLVAKTLNTNMRINCVVAVFLANLSLVFDQRHIVSKDFLLLFREQDGTKHNLYSFFKRSFFQNKSNRLWMLSIIKNGIRESDDVKVLSYRFLNYLLLFHSSGLATNQEKQLIEELVLRCYDEDKTTLSSKISYINSWLQTREISKPTPVTEPKCKQRLIC